MKVNVTNVLDECPPCKDAAVTIDYDIKRNLRGEEVYVNIVMDCEHSGVCAKKGCNAYNAIASNCAVSPVELMGIEDALKGAVEMAHISRPGEEEEAIRAIAYLIPAGLDKNDAERLAQKIACYGNIDAWLEAMDKKKELGYGEA